MRSDGTEAHWVDVPLAAFLAHRRRFRPPPPLSVALSGRRRVYEDMFFFSNCNVNNEKL
jgi:hypothetical protein